MDKLNLNSLTSNRSYFKKDLSNKRFIILLSTLGLSLIILIIMFTNWFLYNPIKESAYASNLTKEEILNQVNQYRINNGLVPLRFNQKVDQAAQSKAQDMANLEYFDHFSPSNKRGISFLLDYGYTYELAGENLAIYHTDSVELVNHWMNSITHRNNLLHPVFQETGIGIAKGVYKGFDTYFVVQMYTKESVSQIQQTPKKENSITQQNQTITEEIRQPQTENSLQTPVDNEVKLPEKTPEEIQKEKEEVFQKIISKNNESTGKLLQEMLARLF